MRQWWTVSGPSYLNHVSKSRVLDVVTEAVDINAAAPLAPLKKDAAVTGAERALAGSGWLPRCLRTGTVVHEEGADTGKEVDAAELAESTA